MKILHLTLKKKWFDLIASGEKTEEYRDATSYWTTRLSRYRKMLGGWGFDEIHFRNGYRKNCPFMRVTFKGITVGLHKRKEVYIIHLGKILEIRNHKK